MTKADAIYMRLSAARRDLAFLTVEGGQEWEIEHTRKRISRLAEALEAANAAARAEEDYRLAGPAAIERDLREAAIRERRSLAELVRAEIPEADDVLARRTTWGSIEGLIARELSHPHPYSPTCRADLDPELAIVADVFDRVMQLAGLDRRATRS